MAEDFAAMMNNFPGNSWVKTMGLHVTRATVDEVECEWDVDERHHQGYGIVHGGVHLVAMSRGQRTVGLENHTSFIRAVRGGKLRGVARPVTAGKTSQVWEGSIYDAENKLVARGTVRLICIPEEKALAGGK